MCHHRGDPPALGAKQPAGDGFQDQADEAQQLQGVLPDGIDSATNPGQQLDANADVGLFDGDAEVGH
ncbi:hypothetical protein D3C81_1849090 [compost metagenome]